MDKASQGAQPCLSPSGKKSGGGESTSQGGALGFVVKPFQGKGSNDPENFGRVAKIWVDPKTNEAYIADGNGN